MIMLFTYTIQHHSSAMTQIPHFVTLSIPTFQYKKLAYNLHVHQAIFFQKCNKYISPFSEHICMTINKITETEKSMWITLTILTKNTNILVFIFFNAHFLLKHNQKYCNLQNKPFNKFLNLHKEMS